MFSGGREKLLTIQSFHKFDSVSKGIAKLKSSVFRDLYTFGYREPAGTKHPLPPVEIDDQVRNVCLSLLSVELVFGTDMDLPVADLQPETTSAGERLRFCYLAQTEKPAIE